MRRFGSRRDSRLRACRLPAAAFCLLVLALAPAAFCANQIISFDPPGSTNTRVAGLNSNGLIVGYYFDSQNVAHGFLRDQTGNVTSFDAPGAGTLFDQGTFPEAINDSGAVAGVYSDSNSRPHAFVRETSGLITEFDVSGAAGTAATAINSNGEIVGWYELTYTSAGFFRDTSGNITTFNPPNCRFITAIRINAGGRTAGGYQDPNEVNHAFLRDASGNVSNFEAPGAGTELGMGTIGADINENGDITGYFLDNSNFENQGFIRNALGSFTEFAVSGAASTTPAAINRIGAVAGWYWDSVEAFHGFTRDNVGNIATFDDPYAGVNFRQGTIPVAINRYGAIAGYYIAGGGHSHGFFRRAQ